MAVDAARSARRLSGRNLLVVLVALATALVTLAGLAVYFGLEAYSDSRKENDRQEASRVASRVMTNIYSVSYQTVDQDLQRTLGDFTGKAKEAMVTGSPKLKAQVTQQQATSKANIRAVGVTELDADSAKVFIAVDTTATSAQVPNGQVGYFRWRLSLTKTGDRWQVSDMGQV